MYKVLLIEDSEQLREVLTQYIESSGIMAVVGHADNPVDAIRMLETQEVHAVIVDLHIKDGSGLQVLSHLERTGNPGRVLRVVLTNWSGAVFRRGVGKLGAEYFFDKSMEFDQAIDVLVDDAHKRMSSQAA